METQHKRRPKRRRKIPVKQKDQVEKWSDVRSELYPKFIAANITSCELQWEGCKGSLYKTFAHSLRRRKIASYSGVDHAEKMREVIRACQSCHQKLDALAHEETYDIVRRIIKERKIQVK